ncbi:hypothetical protein LTR41_003700 [Exophiala xenobiotica]|nr:hypothetical protein LTR41_003700 [Exophiala xenobiotica]
MASNEQSPPTTNGVVNGNVNGNVNGHSELGSSSPKPRILNVGIIGCGEIAQVAHIPNINALAHLFRITYLCDISQDSLKHCSTLVRGPAPQVSTDAEVLCSSDSVDVVFICNADAYHVPHGLLALKHDKYCLIEKPAAVCFRDIDTLIEAEKKSKGRVFVGTMRRFAGPFADMVREVGGMEKIQYARVRDIIGPNSVFVDQSGAFPQRFDDFRDEDNRDREQRETDIADQALGKEFCVPITPQSKRMLRVLGGLGTHDLSAMREILGMPVTVRGACLTFPGIFNVLFEYDGFPVSYECGLSGVPVFDAHIEVYSPNKIVRIDFDSPYIKGLPVTMTVRESFDHGAYQERKIRKTYQDAYTLEMFDLYECVVNGRSPKTSALDARQDIELFSMILRAGSYRYKSANAGPL